eukprot:7340763-Pyramimonas_sp.AAC.1
MRCSAPLTSSGLWGARWVAWSPSRRGGAPLREPEASAPSELHLHALPLTPESSSPQWTS